MPPRVHDTEAPDIGFLDSEEPLPRAGRPSGEPRVPAAPAPSAPSMPPEASLLGSQLFEGLDAVQFDAIADIARFSAVRSGDALFEEGRPGTDVIVVLSGRVEIYVESITPVMEVPLLRAGPGEVVGEMALLGEQFRPYSAFAMTACELLVVDAVELHALLARQPELGLLIMRNTAAILSRRLRLMNLRLMNALRARHLKKDPAPGSGDSAR